MIDINKVYNMECIEGMKRIPLSYIDAVITDPPYYIEGLKEDLKDSTLRSSSKNNIFHADWDNKFKNLEDYKEFISVLLDYFKVILKPKGQCYMFMSYHHIDWVITMIRGKGFKYNKFLIWYKPDTMGVFPNQYGCNYEIILWFRNDGDGGKVKINIGNSQRDVFVKNSTNINYRKECGFHPTCKPISIIKRLVMNCSDENDIILDPFMGSGTTAVACKQSNRRFIGFEISDEYMKIINERLKQKVLNFWE